MRMSKDQKVDLVYRLIILYKSQNDGLSPPLRWLGKELAKLTWSDTPVSLSVISTYIDALVDDGRIERHGSGKKRRIKVVGAAWIASDGWR